MIIIDTTETIIVVGDTRAYNVLVLHVQQELLYINWNKFPNLNGKCFCSPVMVIL